jgi:hypothetical protein
VPLRLPVLLLTVTPTEPTDHYLRSFQWNKVRYRADRPLGELIENLQKELQNIDNDVKAKFVQYTNVKSNLAALQRRQTYVPPPPSSSRFLQLIRHAPAETSRQNLSSPSSIPVCSSKIPSTSKPTWSPYLPMRAKTFFAATRRLRQWWSRAPRSRWPKTTSSLSLR